jgi:hypothetical protein
MLSIVLLTTALVTNAAAPEPATTSTVAQQPASQRAAPAPQPDPCGVTTLAGGACCIPYAVPGSRACLLPAPPREAGVIDIVIAVLFVGVVLGALGYFGRLSSHDRVTPQDLDRLRAAIGDLPRRAQAQAEAGQAWALQAFEALTRASRGPADTSLAIFAVDPPTIPPGSAAQIRIVGTGFDAGARVFVRGTDVTATARVVSDRVIEATAPAGVAGVAAVTIMLPSGKTAYLADAFRCA